MGIHASEKNLDLTNHLVRLWEMKKLPQVQLFENSSKQDLRQFVLDFIKKLLCQDHNLCGFCQNCIRLSLNAYSDLLILEQDASVIKVQEVEKIQNHLKDFPTIEPFIRIVVIFDIDLFHKSAFHKLLKTLEEPCSHNLIVMTTTKKGSIPETLLSRTFVWNLKQFIKRKEIQKQEKISPLDDIFRASSVIEVLEKSDKLGKFPLSEFLSESERWINLYYREAQKTRKLIPENLRTCRLYLRQLRKKIVPLSSSMVAETLGLICTSVVSQKLD